MIAVLTAVSLYAVLITKLTNPMHSQDGKKLTRRIRRTLITAKTNSILSLLQNRIEESKTPCEEKYYLIVFKKIYITLFTFYCQ